MKFTTAIALSVLAAGAVQTAVAQDSQGGFVYTMSNATENAILGYERGSDGGLYKPFSVATGGAGTGANIGSDNALVLSEDGRWLFAINGGSNSISVLERNSGVLTLRSTISAGGTKPESLAVSGDLVYVLNDGAPAHINGFFFDDDHGKLYPIADSTRSLSIDAPDAPQIAFDKTGALLFVTEKATNFIDSFEIQADATPAERKTMPSNGKTPFGVAFDRWNNLIVSEAFGGAAKQSALSSYEVDSDGYLETISASVPTNQSAACWVVVTQNGKYTYTSDTGNGVITGYRIGRSGALSLLQQSGFSADTGGVTSKPVDLALSRRSEYLYSVNSGTGTLFGWAISPNGDLQRIKGAIKLPLSATGLVAR